MPVTRYYINEFSRRPMKSFLGTMKKKKSINLPFTATRLLLGILGGIPCQLHHPYWPSSDVRKSSFLYCIAVYLVASFNAVWTSTLKLQQYEGKGSVNVGARNFELIQFLGLLPHLLGLVLWIDTNTLSKCMESFIDIQRKFVDATGKQLVNRRGGLERFSIAFMVIFPVLFTMFSQKYILIMRIEETSVIALLYSHLLLVLINLYWMGVSLSLTDALDDARIELEWQLTNRKITSQSIFSFRVLWLSLRSAMDSMDKLYAPITVNLITFFLTIAGVYEAAVLLQIHEVLAAVGNFIVALLLFGYFSITCIVSNRTQQKMKTFVDDTLPNIMLSSYDIGTQREIVMLYLSGNARPVVSSLRGLTVVNKKLILSFLSNVATYIIVLFQLDQNT